MMVVCISMYILESACHSHKQTFGTLIEITLNKKESEREGEKKRKEKTRQERNYLDSIDKFNEKCHLDSIETFMNIVYPLIIPNNVL